MASRFNDTRAYFPGEDSNFFKVWLSSRFPQRHPINHQLKQLHDCLFARFVQGQMSDAHRFLQAVLNVAPYRCRCAVQPTDVSSSSVLLSSSSSHCKSISLESHAPILANDEPGVYT